MPLDTGNSLRMSPKPALDLPPPYRLVTLREVGDAFAYATAIAAEQGAGTLVYVGRFDLAEFAVVLEPDEPLKSARRALYAGLAALGEVLTAYAPPGKLVTFDWPDTILVDGGLVGGVRLAWPRGADEDEIAPWLVFGAMIRTVATGEEEPGLRPFSAALEEEGFDDIGSGRLVESFARHLMVVTDIWQEKGFAEVARAYLGRVTGASFPPPAGGGGKGGAVRREIADNGDLLLRHLVSVSGKPEVERRALVPALAQPSWLDPATGGPKL
jgi:biotin-(acetyl-CoA carboxylase) ligase